MGRTPLEALSSADLREVDHAVAEIAAVPAQRSDPDALYAAGRAAEDKLLDPVRAVAIYDRVLAEHPGARVAAAADRRAAPLRELIGPAGETAAQARELAQLVGRADALPAAGVLARAEQLARTSWRGAPVAALWLADWLRRSGRYAEALARYAEIPARWPDRPEALAAMRGAAGCALDARDWPLAEALADRLPAADPLLRSERDDLLAAAARGRRHDRWYVIARIAVGLALAVLLGSLAEVIARSPRGSRLSVLRPPIEIAFLAPVAAVLIGVAFTAHRLIAPAVAIIAIGGLVTTWLSGAVLEQLRARGRPRRLRSVVHVAACLASVGGLGYVAMIHGGLLDALLETIRLGPGG